jgi:hypothetical protein
MGLGCQHKKKPRLYVSSIVQPNCCMLAPAYGMDSAKGMNLGEQRYLLQAAPHVANLRFFDNEEEI